MLKNILFTFVFLAVYCSATAQEGDCNYYKLPKPNAVPKDFGPKILDLNGSFKFNLEKLKLKLLIIEHRSDLNFFLFRLKNQAFVLR